MSGVLPMNMENEKCVIIIDESLPLGVTANTAAILGITLGMKRPGIVGPDVMDREGHVHRGIIRFPVPVLKATREHLHSLRAKLFSAEYASLTVVDFSSLAQDCKTYDEFISKMSACSDEELSYTGIAICGSRKKVNKLTGNMPLLR